MVKENTAHRSHKLNPRKHPLGTQIYPTPSKERIWDELGDFNKKVMMSTSEQQLIQDIPRHLGNGNYANLGHSSGGSAILLGNGLKEYQQTKKIYSIDIRFKPGSNALIEEFKVQNLIKKCEGSTDEWAEKLSKLVFNFVFIDADHCYDAVVKDIRNWSPLVRKEGWISLHDTNQDFSHQAIEDTMSKEWVELKEFHIHRIRTFQRVK